MDEENTEDAIEPTSEAAPLESPVSQEAPDASAATAEPSAASDAGIGETFDMDLALGLFDQARGWVEQELLTMGSLFELGAIGIAFVLAMITDGWCSRLVSFFHKKYPPAFLRSA